MRTGCYIFTPNEFRSQQQQFLYLDTMENYLRRFLQPPSFTFNSSDLGPFIFKQGTHTARRQQIKINSIPCSIYEVNTNNPTILYIHTYNSHRLEVQPLLRHLIAEGFNVASIELQRVVVNEEKQVYFDNKEGIITFGFYEYEQIRPIMEAIRKKFKNQQIILWGRSMGAACGILYQQKYKDCNHLILDSPFHSIQQLMATKLNEFTSFPSFFTKKGVHIAKGSLNEILHFDISQFQLTEKIKNIQCPITFVYNPQDPVSNTSTLLLYERCSSKKKQIFYTQSAHDQSRQQSVIQSICSDLTVRMNKNKKSLLLKKLDHLPTTYQKVQKRYSLRETGEVHLLAELKKSQSTDMKLNDKKLIRLGGSSPKINPIMDLDSSINKSTRNSAMLSDCEGRVFLHQQ